MNDLPSSPSRNTCYACEQPAATKEHAPPKSFFPESKRRNLITVPSCSVHNCDRSPDVEYVRNAIVSLVGLTGIGDLTDIAKRSFDRSPALFVQTFRSFVVHSPEGQLGAFKWDLPRVKSMMTAVAQALHYRDQRQKWDRWQVFVPSLASESSLIHKRDDGWESLRDLLGRIPYIARSTAEPEVFSYGSYALNWGWVYQLTFYSGFVVNAWMLREEREAPYKGVESGQRQLQRWPNA